MRRRFNSRVKSRTQWFFTLFLAALLIFIFLPLSRGPAVSSFISSFISLPAPSPIPSYASFELGFSPRGQSLNIILNGIGRAENSILVAAYSFTSRPISTALLEAHRRGVAVRVIADARANTSQYTAVTFLANQGVPVRVNGRYAIFHHKFMVFDNRHVQTGSFNYSAAAVNRNTENVLLLLNVPEIADMYAREWERLWNESQEVRPSY